MVGVVAQIFARTFSSTPLCKILDTPLYFMSVRSNAGRMRCAQLHGSTHLQQWQVHAVSTFWLLYTLILAIIKAIRSNLS